MRDESLCRHCELEEGCHTRARLDRVCKDDGVEVATVKCGRWKPIGVGAFAWLRLKLSDWRIVVGLTVLGVIALVV
jgi:hypothetical protein